MPWPENGHEDSYRDEVKQLKKGKKKEKRRERNKKETKNEIFNLNFLILLVDYCFTDQKGAYRVSVLIEKVKLLVRTVQ